jgi:predicted DNA-binding transcriptional regulator YafY
VRADRLISLLLLLQAHGRLSAGDVARRLEVSRRTVFRDIDALSAAGVPIAVDRGPQGGAYLLGGFRTDLTGLTEPEFEALLAFGGQGPAADLGFGRDLDQAARKLVVAAGRGSPGRLQQRVLVDGGRWFRAAPVPPHLARVQDALFSNRRVRLKYRRAVDRIVERTVEPYGLVCKAGTWYLLAGVEGGTRTYRISRIEDAVLTDETFERPAAFDLRSAWAEHVSRFQRQVPEHVAVTVRVDPDVSELFTRAVGDRVVHRSGNGVVVLDFPACEAAVGPLAAFGHGVEILQPQDLRDRLGEIGRQLSTLYSEPDGRRVVAGSHKRHRGATS